MKLNSITQAIIITIGCVVIMMYLESILIPFIFSIIVWFLIRELKQLMNSIPVVAKYTPVFLQNLIAFIIIIGAIVLVGMLLANNINHMIQKGPKYTKNIEHVMNLINDALGINILDKAREHLDDLNFANIIRSVFDSLSAVLSNIFLVIIYVLFLMAEESVIPRKLKNIYQNEERYQNARQIISEVNNSLSSYISLKTIISLITGVASFIALWIIGVDFAIFWATLIFLLNYIPTIGSLIATVFPALMALLQFSEFGPFLLVLSIVGAIQMVVGNYLEPKLMGNTLNISSLVVIISLSFWGLIWGVVGMFLSVPVTVMMIIVFSKFPATRPVSIWLSGTGIPK